jgi:hypothetical protein
MYVHIEFYLPNFNRSLDIVFRLKTKYFFHTNTIVSRPTENNTSHTLLIFLRPLVVHHFVTLHEVADTSQRVSAVCHFSLWEFKKYDAGVVTSGITFVSGFIEIGQRAQQ